MCQTFGHFGGLDWSGPLRVSDVFWDLECWENCDMNAQSQNINRCSFSAWISQCWWKGHSYFEKRCPSFINTQCSVCSAKKTLVFKSRIYIEKSFKYIMSGRRNQKFLFIFFFLFLRIILLQQCHVWKETKRLMFPIMDNFKALYHHSPLSLKGIFNIRETKEVIS